MMSLANAHSAAIAHVLLTGVLLTGAPALADPYTIDGTAPNRWPAVVAFTAPCGVVITRPDDPGWWEPPPTLINADTVAPAALCATKMRTLTDPDSVQVTTIDAVNPAFKGLPDGTSLPMTSSLTGGGTSAPQDPINAPSPIVEMAGSGNMHFLVPAQFRDTTDTKFEGKVDAVLEMPIDARKCPNGDQSGVIDSATGLHTIVNVPDLCLIRTPADYLTALQQGHVIKWVQYTTSSIIFYGPADPILAGPVGASVSWQQQAAHSSVDGTLILNYATDNNSTVLRIGVRYGIGYNGTMPLTWGGWPTPPCTELNCLAPAYWAGMQTAWVRSQPFTVVVKPLALVQLHYLPTLILYQPPGDQSSATFATSDTYTQNYQTDEASTITDKTEYDARTKEDLSLSPGWSYMGLGQNVTLFPLNTSWDNDTKTTTGESYGLSVSAIVSQGLTETYTTAKIDLSSPDVAHLAYATEPFWSDMIYVAMHPQFALWDYPSGVKLQPLGSAGIYGFSVQELTGCLPKIGQTFAQAPPLPVQIDIVNPDNSTTHKMDQLSATECARLLALDPFYVGRSQAAVPGEGISVPPGSHSLTPAGYQVSSTAITTFSTKSSYSKTITATVTSSRQNTSSEGSSENIWGAKFSYEYLTTGTSSTSNDVTMVLGSSITAQAVHSVTSTMNLVDCLWMNNKADCDLPAAAPSPQVEMFMDARFGTMMGVLPDLTITPPAAHSVSVREHVGDAAFLQSIGLTESHVLQLPDHIDTPLLRQPVPKKVLPTLLAAPRAVPLPLVRPAPGAVAPLAQKWVGKVF